MFSVVRLIVIDIENSLIEDKISTVDMESNLLHPSLVLCAYLFR